VAFGPTFPHMIRRSLPHRLLAAFCAVWLAISIAAPGLVHECPMHGSVAPVQLAAHGSHAGSHAASHDAAAPEHAAAACSCLGDCAAAGGVSLAAAPMALLDAPVVAVVDPGLPDHAYVPVAHALLLPFANGPPSLPPSVRVL
jgi:hypothetical protein